MENEQAFEIIKTIGENGEEIFMKLQEIVTIDGKDYALLSVVENDTLPNSDNNDEELIVMRMIKNDNECTFEIIESDEEFNFVVQAIQDADEEDEE